MSKLRKEKRKEARNSGKIVAVKKKAVVVDSLKR